jgi:hypothetical protein
MAMMWICVKNAPFVGQCPEPWPLSLWIWYVSCLWPSLIGKTWLSVVICQMEIVRKLWEWNKTFAHESIEHSAAPIVIAQRIGTELQSE